MIRYFRNYAVVLLLLIATLAVTACGGLMGAVGKTDGTRLTLVSYSTPKGAYDKIIPAFQHTSQGKGVTFDTSYGASGTQSRAVDQGLPADVVAFSLAPDVDRLVKDGIVAKAWANDRYRGMVTDSVVVFVVRPGNPKHIHIWQDLIRPGVQVVTPNPFTSGGARWNIMAAYGAQIEQGRSPQEARDYLSKLLNRVVVQDKSARESMQTFLGGKGDVLLAYENEAITAQHKGEKVDYVVPDQTILIENPVAVTTKSKHSAQAKAFVNFLRTPKAQRIFAENGYRPVLKTVLSEYKFPEPQGLFSIEKLGGWPVVTKRFFDPSTGIVAKLEQSKGVSVEPK